MKSTTFLPLLVFFVVLIPATLLTDPAEVAEATFDYVIAGGGLTGLTTAVRLTADPNISVLVIESGYDQASRGSIIEDLTVFGQGFDTTLDHAFETVSLEVNGRPLTIRAGNGLGGSTLINGATWTSPAKVQIDSWESHLENKGWTWEDLFFYIRQAERARPPNKDQIAAGHVFDHRCHGVQGAVNVGPRDTSRKYSPLLQELMALMTRRGIPTRRDLSCGDPHGVSMFLNTVYDNQTRADAARAFLLPNSHRPNLQVLMGQTVGKVLFNNNISPPLATSVQFGTHAETFEVYAKHEVLLAAGALVSPLILEYSGVGLKSVLATAGVPQIVDLPVGQNLQDQTTTAVRADLHTERTEQGQAAYFATWDELFDNVTRIVARGLLDSNLDQWVDDVVSSGGFGNRTALRAQFELYRDLLLEEKVAYAELFMDVGVKAVGFSVWVLIPFTRGYVHIVDRDPFLRRVVRNPRYLENPLDRYAQAAASRMARNITSGDVFRQFIAQESLPGSAVSSNASMDAWIEYVTQNFQSNFHAVGTCSMMARDLGGVVDPAARVYGLQNLRVIDASIIPTQVSAHTSAMLYGIAEKLSNLILADYYSRSTDIVGRS